MRGTVQARYTPGRMDLHGLGPRQTQDAPVYPRMGSTALVLESTKTGKGRKEPPKLHSPKQKTGSPIAN